MDGQFVTYIRPQRGAAAVETHDGLTMVVAGWPYAEFDAGKKDIEGNYLKVLDLAPAFAARIRGAKREAPFIGSPVPNFFRVPYGPGWALVGDAGYHKDPITAQGITDAFRDSELLADALDAGFTGTRPLDEALADYERVRNEETRGLYELTYEFASLAPPAPEQQALFAALRENEADTNRFFGVVAGTVRPDEFFAPENIGRIVGAPVPA
jgi:2-polyprenyl-6-methoxyphenol hydroxylase-like FAD-dependent oxidoreductase